MQIKTRPNWVFKKISFDKLNEIQRILNKFKINTICESARCPNISECFSKKTATFLILGRNCTRHCLFCNVNKENPEKIDEKESQKILDAVIALNLKYVVITSVTRDDVPDGGAFLFADCIKKIKSYDKNIKVEILVPDFLGNYDAILKIIEQKPDIFGHNLETVPELYHIRKGASYKRSLDILYFAKKNGMTTKTAILLGLGEKDDQVINVFKDLRNVNCDFLSIGHYLQPNKNLLPVKEYIPLEKFKYYEEIAKSMGFLYVKSGPFVRSSYCVEEYFIKN